MTSISGERNQDILDPEVIAKCGEMGWFLITADKDMPFRWAKEIKLAGVGVFCQTNNQHGHRLWIPRFIALKNQIIRKATNVTPPFVFHVTADAKPKLVRKEL